MGVRGTDRKAEILDAAVARIVAGGIEGLRVRDVAADVGINNATLHHHFPTKATLVEALVQRFLARFKIAGGVPEDGPLEARLAAYVETRCNLMRHDPGSFIVLTEIMVLARRDEGIQELLAGQQERWMTTLVSACRDAGLDAPAALVRAERCRREVLGACLDLCIGRFM